jgi:predicted transcriptional regulator
MENGMPTAKEEVRKLLDELPPEASYEDIQYHIYVREKIERGLQDVREGRVLTEEEFEQRAAKWFAD